MLRSAKAVIGTIAFMLALGPAGLAAEDRLESPGISPAVSPSIGPVGTGRCELAAPQQDQDQPRTRRGVLGWLYKYTRNIDIERASSPRLPGFLRSPLLGTLPGRTGECDPNALPALDEAVTCAVISLDPGTEDSIIFTVPMPQLGEATLGGLQDEIRDRLSRGHKVKLETSKGSMVRIAHDATRYVNARECRTDA